LHMITLSDTHTHTHTLGRSPLDEGSARRKDHYLTTHIYKRQISMPLRDSNPQSQQVSGRKCTISKFLKNKILVFLLICSSTWHTVLQTSTAIVLKIRHAILCSPKF